MEMLSALLAFLWLKSICHQSLVCLADKDIISSCDVFFVVGVNKVFNKQ